MRGLRWYTEGECDLDDGVGIFWRGSATKIRLKCTFASNSSPLLTYGWFAGDKNAAHVETVGCFSILKTMRKNERKS